MNSKILLESFIKNNNIPNETILKYLNMQNVKYAICEEEEDLEILKRSYRNEEPEVV